MRELTCSPSRQRSKPNARSEGIVFQARTVMIYERYSFAPAPDTRVTFRLFLDVKDSMIVMGAPPGMKGSLEDPNHQNPTLISVPIEDDSQVLDKLVMTFGPIGVAMREIQDLSSLSSESCPTTVSSICKASN